MSPIAPSVLLALVLALTPAIGVSAPEYPMDKASPMEAIRLATTLGAEDIEAVDDPETWYWDAKVRSWNVFRVAETGFDDTTHDFMVVYVLDGKPLIEWHVDTRAGTVLRLDRKVIGCTFRTPQWCPPKPGEVTPDAAP
jgi:hypothetical protein